MSQPRAQTTRWWPHRKAKRDILSDSEAVSANVEWLSENDENTIGMALAAALGTPREEDASGSLAAHTSPSRVSSVQERTDDVTTPVGIARYFDAATKNFVKMIERAIESLVANLERIWEAQLGQAIEFESRRVMELEDKKKHPEKRMEQMEGAMTSLRMDVAKHNEQLNKVERFSRRNNIRLVVSANLRLTGTKTA